MRTCKYPTCDRPVVGPPEKEYCGTPCRRKWDAAVKHFGKVTCEGGKPFALFVARLYDEHIMATERRARPVE